MIYAQEKYAICLEPLSLTNGATASLVVDTKGAFIGTSDNAVADYLAIDVLCGRTNAATNVPSVFKLQESDITNATGYSDISGSSYTTAVTSQSTTAGNNYTYFVSLPPRKRYIKLLVSPVTTQVIAAVANLSRMGMTPQPTSLLATGSTAAPILL